MKKVIKINESKFRSLIKENVVFILNEMGTIRQNELLRKLTGSDKYDNLSVPEASNMISNLLKNQSPILASEKQINFLIKRGVDWVRDVELTAKDASAMIGGLMKGRKDIVNRMAEHYGFKQMKSNNMKKPLVTDAETLNEIHQQKKMNGQREVNYNPTEHEQSVYDAIDTGVINKGICFYYAYPDIDKSRFVILANNCDIPQNTITVAKHLYYSSFDSEFHLNDIYVFIDRNNNRWYHSRREFLELFLKEEGLL